ARRFAAALLGHAVKIERDDLSLQSNLMAIEERLKWTAEKRNDDPLFFASHPDFVTFAPDGPLRQLTMQQMRLLRAHAQFKPLKGSHRVFLIDDLDHANEQAANSLLKVLEEPPEHLIIIATAENVYDLLPTIRSRALILQMSRLSDSEMEDFAQRRALTEAEARIALSEGCPGIAATLDLDEFRTRRGLMLTAFECGAGVAAFSSWLEQSEPFSMKKAEKLDLYLKLAYGLLEDILARANGRPALRNRDIQPRIDSIVARVTFAWIERAVRQVDELVEMTRRNIQKTAALDGLIVSLRRSP
ncbi:MAG: hypothetical protein JO061_19535, partial [Acidobacteriaceae bacterium]|nr:hypothetical protein [Acidobacteriaceae bacterium]